MKFCQPTYERPSRYFALRYKGCFNDGTYYKNSVGLDPYIVENGAAIYGDNFNNANGKIILGEKYETLEEILNNISIDINSHLLLLMIPILLLFLDRF